MRKFLLAVFLIVLIFALFYKSPFSALCNYNKAKSLYDNGRYEESLPYFERSLFADSKGILSRFFYVLALSKSEPTYSVQKKLYEMSISKIDDEASKYAKIQAMALRYKLLKGLENNYIYNAAMGSDIVRWDIKSFPLAVYIEKTDSVPDYYYKSIEEAMDEWVKHTNFVKFKLVESESDADIIINFKNIPDDVCRGNVCNYTVAYTEPEISGDKLLKKMRLTFYKTNPKNQGYTPKQIFNTAVHELGHTLGIMGHSDNPSDIMYSLKEDDIGFYNYYTFGNHTLSLRDLQTLVLLYRIKPTITNTNLSDNAQIDEKLYFSPLIIGNNDVILRKKLNEYRSYIAQYPHLAAGYINISSVYSDMGDFKSALSALDAASKYVQNDDEKYIIEYNLGVIFYNMQDYDKALAAANRAKALKDDSAINNLIADILKLQK